MKRLICALALIGTLVGLAGPANAAPADSSARAAAVSWYPYTGTGPTWHCGPTADHGSYHEQICTIVNGRNYQGALIFVADVSDYYISSTWNIRNRNNGDFRLCDGYVAAGTRVVCFAPTETGNAGDYVQGYALDHDVRDMYGPTITLR
ncbi:hypothetical protein Asp14428_40500 [Actinoplanes sp. NBRC 14428]|nr:hypothetical protein Asp14428_40500 [Actinoplanes sp. NBRC 14428]